MRRVLQRRVERRRRSRGTCSCSSCKSCHCCSPSSWGQKRKRKRKRTRNRHARGRCWCLAKLHLHPRAGVVTDDRTASVVRHWGVLFGRRRACSRGGGMRCGGSDQPVHARLRMRWDACWVLDSGWNGVQHRPRLGRAVQLWRGVRREATRPERRGRRQEHVKPED